MEKFVGRMRNRLDVIQSDWFRMLCELFVVVNVVMLLRENLLDKKMINLESRSSRQIHDHQRHRRYQNLW